MRFQREVLRRCVVATGCWMISLSAWFLSNKIVTCESVSLLGIFVAARWRLAACFAQIPLKSQYHLFSRHFHSRNSNWQNSHRTFEYTARGWNFHRQTPVIIGNKSRVPRNQRINRGGFERVRAHGCSGRDLGGRKRIRAIQSLSEFFFYTRKKKTEMSADRPTLVEKQNNARQQF